MNPASLAYTARWVWLGPGDLRENAVVLVAEGRVQAIEAAPPQGARVVDLGQGLLMPGLVNAHTHLELSGLAGLVPPAGDFVGWLEQMVALRPARLRVNGAAATTQAVAELAAMGTSLVGDITNTMKAMPALAKAGLSSVSFVEALGQAKAEPPAPAMNWNGAKLQAVAVAAHAPYSVPAARLKALKQKAGSLPFCMHLAESRAEVEFMADSGPEGKRLEEFLAMRGVRRHELDIQAPSPLAHAQALGLLDEHTLLVHGVQLTPAEAAKLAQTKASLCVCPRSNLGLTRALAPVQELLAAGVNLALGTDSLASCPDLSIWKEMTTLHRAMPKLPVEQILAMATAGGARALGLEGRFGVIRPGACLPLAFAPLNKHTARDQVLEAVVRGDYESQPRAVPGTGPEQ